MKNNVKLYITIDEGTKKDLTKMAEERKTSMSAVVRELVLKEKKKQKNKRTIYLDDEDGYTDGELHGIATYNHKGHDSYNNKYWLKWDLEGSEEASDEEIQEMIEDQIWDEPTRIYLMERFGEEKDYEITKELDKSEYEIEH